MDTDKIQQKGIKGYKAFKEKFQKMVNQHVVCWIIKETLGKKHKTQIVLMVIFQTVTGPRTGKLKFKSNFVNNET